MLLEDPCYARSGEQVTLRRGERRALTLEAKPHLAALRVDAEDERHDALEAQVRVDGREVGSTPGVFQVSVCSRRVEVARGSRSFSADLRLRPGEETPVVALLRSASTRDDVVLPAEPRRAPTYSAAPAPVQSAAGGPRSGASFLELCCRTLLDGSISVQVGSNVMYTLRGRSMFVSIGSFSVKQNCASATASACPEIASGLEFALWPLQWTSWHGAPLAAGKGGWGFEPFAALRRGSQASAAVTNAWAVGGRSFLDFGFMYVAAGVEYGPSSGPAEFTGFRITFDLGASVVFNRPY